MQVNLRTYMRIWTLWLFNIAMENDPFIDGLPIKNDGSFPGYVSHNQMVNDKLMINGYFTQVCDLGTGLSSASTLSKLSSFSCGLYPESEFTLW